MSHDPGRLFDAVGLTAQEERTYLLLLDHPGLNAAELAGLLDLSEHTATARLSELEVRGLAARSTSGPGYLPAPPDIAIGALIDRKHEELQRAARSVSRLIKRTREAVSRRARRDSTVELVTGQDAVMARLDQLQRTATREIRGFVTASCPYRIPQRTLEQARARGVEIRMVYDRRTLDVPDMLITARRQAAAGAHVRVAASLPVTLALFDRRVALVPEFDEIEGALLVSASTILNALRAFVEITWERASPLGSTPNGDLDIPPGLPEQEDLVTLLAAGYKDEAIARRLGLSTRTLDRRVRTLMTSLDANTRFQAGWLAGHRAAAKHH